MYVFVNKIVFFLSSSPNSQGPGAFSPFLAAMLISYLIQEKRLSKRMMSQQIVKGTLNYLGEFEGFYCLFFFDQVALFQMSEDA